MGGPLTAPKKIPSLGAGLRAIRAMADLSLDELATESGISRMRLHYAERDRLSFAKTGSASLDGRPGFSDRLETRATDTRPPIRTLRLSTLSAGTRAPGSVGW
jgi:transcriptional regulator with XRE-family HTH domain